MPAGAPSSQPPTVDRIDSLHGPTTGGNQITFTGTGFDAETRIQFAGNWGEVVSVAADGTQATVTVPAGNKGTSNINIVNSVGNVLLDTLMYTYWEDIGDQSTGLLAILDYSRDVGGYWDETENSTGSAFFWENTATPETMNPIEWYQYLGIPGVNTCAWNVSQTGVSGAPIDTEYELLRFTSETGTSFEIPASSGGDGWLPSFDRSSLPALEPGRRYTLTTEYANGWPALSIDNILTGPRAIAITYPDIATPKDEVPTWDLSQPAVWNQSATNDDYVLLSFTTETGDTLSCAGQDNGLLFLDETQQAELREQLFEVTGCRVNHAQSTRQPSPSIMDGRPQWFATVCGASLTGNSTRQLAREYLGIRGKGLELQGIATWVEEKHGGLFAGLPP